jgi:hypothetical protein
LPGLRSLRDRGDIGAAIDAARQIPSAARGATAVSRTRKKRDSPAQVVGMVFASQVVCVK